jgi:ketosteroid isomerase-like protein
MTAEKQQDQGRTFLSILSHPDADVIRRVAVDDFVWSFPGSSSISGEAHGVEGVMKRAQTIASFGVKVEILRAVYGLSGVSVLLHNTGNKNGHILDEQVVAVFTFRGDKLARLDTYLSDVAMAEKFFG